MKSNLRVGRVSIRYGVRNTCPDEQRSESLEPLIKVLRRWGELTNLYCRTLKEDNDAPYFYNERPNISILAASAWKSNFVALEEYRTDKKSAKKAGKTSQGRADLFIGNESHGFIIEAKQHWMEATQRDSTVANRIMAYMKNSVLDAAKNTDITSRLGCVFFIPIFPQARFRPYAPRSEQLIEAELRRYVGDNGHRADLWAWAFPDETRIYREKSKAGVFRYFPGVIVALKAAPHFG